MSPSMPACPTKRDSNLHIRVADDHFAAMRNAANSAGLKLTEWARQELVRAVSQPRALSLGPQHAQLFMEQLITINALLEQQLLRSTTDSRPFTKEELKQLFKDLQTHKAMGAQSELARLSIKIALPLKKD